MLFLVGNLIYLMIFAPLCVCVCVCVCKKGGGLGECGKEKDGEIDQWQWVTTDTFSIGSCLGVFLGGARSAG